MKTPGLLTTDGEATENDENSPPSIRPTHLRMADLSPRISRRPLLFAGSLISVSASFAQQGLPLTKVGVLCGSAGDAVGQAQIAALLTRPVQLGWVEGQNLELDIRFARGLLR